MPRPLRSDRRPYATDEPLLRKTITIPASYLRLLEQEGRGSLSAGIRLMMEHACTPNGYYWFPMGRSGPRRLSRPISSQHGRNPTAELGWLPLRDDV